MQWMSMTKYANVNQLQKKQETRDPYFRLSASVIGVNTTDTWKLSMFHLRFSKLQMKCNVELSIVVKAHVGTLTRQILQKAKNMLSPKIDNRVSFNAKIIDLSCKGEVSDMSEASVSELRVKLYEIAQNKKGKNNRKSRRCVDCNKLSIAYCGYCNKTHYYAIEGTGHGRTCLVNYVKMIKQKNECRKYRGCRLQ